MFISNQDAPYLKDYLIPVNSVIGLANKIRQQYPQKTTLIMNFIKHLKCSACQTVYPANELMNLCPKDNRPIEVIIDVEKVKATHPHLEWMNQATRSLWRYGAMLPLNSLCENDQQHIVSLGEGFTPEIPLLADELAKKHQFNLWLKDEGQPHRGYGANPTGSFKDRGMTMAVSMAKRFGVKKVVVPTQGNAGDSMVEYAMKAGMDAVVIMPDDTPMPIMGRVAALANIHDNIQLELVKGTIREAGELMKSKYVPQDYFNMATFQEPGWRIDGKKTLGYEVAEPKDDHQTQWQVPDVILYPTGGGTGILGMWKAFDELEQLGLIDSKRPKIISVQSNQTAPLVNAFNDNAKDTTPVNAGNTIATGLNVPGGVGHFKVLDIIQQSHGAAIAVDESAIAEKLTEIYHEYGVWISPEGAATLAAIEPAIERDLIQSGDRVVAFNTGSFEKYLGSKIRELIFLQ